MGCGGNRDTSFPDVRDHGQTALPRGITDTAGLGEATDTADVGLHNLHAAAIHEIQKLEARSEPFARSNWYGLLLAHACIPLKVVAWQRCLHKEKVEWNPIAQHS